MLILIVFFRVVSAEGPLFSQPVYHVSVAEDTLVGAPITRVTAESPSGAPLVYTVVAGDPNRIFSLDYSTGRHPTHYLSWLWCNVLTLLTLSLCNVLTLLTLSLCNALTLLTLSFCNVLTLLTQ